MALAHSIWTLLLAFTFIGIVVWAWSGRRREQFAEAARLPLYRDHTVGSTRPADERRDHG